MSWVELKASVADAERKAFATRQAQAALRGWKLEQVPANDQRGGFYLTKWGMSRYCSDVRDLDRALRDIGCPPMEKSSAGTVAG